MKSHLSIKTKYTNGRTLLADSYFTSPYKVTSPLYHSTWQNEEQAEIMLMSSSAGLLKDDEVTMDFHFGSQSNVKISSQSYEKIFDTQEGMVRRHTNIILEENASVLFMPKPTIPFRNSCFFSKTKVELNSNSTFYYSDIFTAGRVHMEESFAMKNFHSILEVFVDGKIAFCDNTRIEPSKHKYNSLGLWHDFTHNALLYIYKKNEEDKAFISLIREEASKEIPQYACGVTQVHQGILVRVLGNQGDKISRFFEQITLL